MKVEKMKKIKGGRGELKVQDHIIIFDREIKFFIEVGVMVIRDENYFIDGGIFDRAMGEIFLGVGG